MCSQGQCLRGDAHVQETASVGLSTVDFCESEYTRVCVCPVGLHSCLCSPVCEHRGMHFTGSEHVCMALRVWVSVSFHGPL